MNANESLTVTLNAEEVAFVARGLLLLRNTVQDSGFRAKRDESRASDDEIYALRLRFQEPV